MFSSLISHYLCCASERNFARNDGSHPQETFQLAHDVVVPVVLDRDALRDAAGEVSNPIEDGAVFQRLVGAV